MHGVIRRPLTPADIREGDPPCPDHECGYYPQTTKRMNDDEGLIASIGFRKFVHCSRQVQNYGC